jgi:hypothetical protein
VGFNNEIDFKMKPQILGLRVAGTLFGFMSLAQLARLVLQADISIAGYVLPLWPSLPAFILMGCLSFWMWKLSRNPPENR